MLKYFEIGTYERTLLLQDLRNGKEVSELQESLNEIKTFPKYKGMLRRVLSFKDMVEVNSYLMWLMNNIEEGINDIWSTTKGSRLVVFHGGKEYKVVLHIESETARDVSNNAQFKCEEEVIVLPNTKFELVGMDISSKLLFNHNHPVKMVINVYLKEKLSLA